MVDKVLAANIQNLVTDGASAARLINDEKRAINELIDRDNTLGNVVTRNTGIGDNDVPLNSELETVLDSKQARLKPISSVAALRSYEPSYDGQQIELLGHTSAGVGGGVFYSDFSDSSSTDDNGYVIVTTAGRRWKRKVSGLPRTSMFNGSINSLSLGFDSIFVDSDMTVNSNLSLTTNLIEAGGSITVTSGVTLTVSNYESNGEYFLRRADTTSIINGLYTNDTTMQRVQPKAGQPGLKFNAGYDMSATSGGYVNQYTTPTRDIPQEHGECFAYVKFRGSLGQFRFLFKDSSNSTQQTVNVYPMGSPSVFDSDRSAQAELFNNDDEVKEAIIFSGISREDGFFPKVQVAIHPSSAYNQLQVDIQEIRIGYMNDRHVSRSPSKSPLGLKTISVREGISSLWFNDSDDNEIRRIISESLKYNIDSVQIVMLYKAAINADLSINQVNFARFEKMLWWLSNNGVVINICANHIFGDESLPDLIVYDDQILTAPERALLKSRMAEFVKLISQHPSVHMIEVQNEANLAYDDPSVITSSSIPQAYLSDMVDAVHENSDKLASVSFSGGGVKAMFALSDYGQDFVDMHAYDGNSTQTVRPYAWPIISSEHGSPTRQSTSIGIEAAEEYAETFGPWWRYVTPGEGAFNQTTRDANALALAGGRLPSIDGDTTAYASSIAHGVAATTLGITRLQDPEASASGDPIEYVNANGTWVNGFMLP